MTRNSHRQSDLVLGIDLGTSACKVCAVRTDGRLVATATADYRTHTPQPGWAQQNPHDWLPAVARATTELLETNSIDPKSVIGLALDSAAHVAVLLDSDHQPTRDAILWNDQRSQPQVDELQAIAGDEIFTRTHNPISTTWTLPHLAWIRRHDPDAWSRTRRICLSKDYLAYQLTGALATDPATALSSLLYDAVDNRWSASLCDLVAITPAMLPTVLPPTATIGHLTDQAAQSLHLMSGIPVINGTLDNAAETYAAGVVSSADALLRLASAGGIHFVFETARPHPRLITYPHPIAPLWFSQAGTNTCASAVKWAIQTFTSGRGLSFTDWDQQAAQVSPGSDGLIFHPYLTGERCPHWDSQLRASFVGVALHHTAAHFARAVYEGAAFSIRDALSVLEEIGPSPTTLTTVGGGAQSRLWLQIVSDCLGRPLKIPSHRSSSYGAALLALTGLGLFDTPAAALAATPIDAAIIQPNQDNHHLYNQLFEKYRDIHAKLSPIYHHP